MVSKITGIELQQGQRVRLQTPGGGGYGRALERSVEEVITDVKNEFVSVTAARDAYGVVIESDGKINHRATEELRATRVRDENRP